MKYSYTAYGEEINEGQKLNDGKSIKEPVKITIEIEIEKKKYESLKKKYTVSIAEKIIKIFK